jgi:hypothetical protein
MSVAEDNQAAKAEVCRSSAAFLGENIDVVVSLGVSAEGYPTCVDNFTNLEAGMDIPNVNLDQASYLILWFFLHFLSRRKSSQIEEEKKEAADLGIALAAKRKSIKEIATTLNLASLVTINQRATHESMWPWTSWESPGM